MTVAIIADAHLGGPGGTAGPLLAQLDALPGDGVTRLILLGDIFQVWIGDPRFETEHVRALLPAVARLRAAGVRVDYVEGNRDFFLEDGPYAECFDSLGLELAFEVGGRRFLAVHGDGLNDRDRKYRFWRWASKNRLSHAVVRLMPSPLVRRIALGTERRLERTNFKHKIRVPEQAILAWGEKRLAEGYDVLLLGHFHQPRTFRLAGGEIRLLDAWFNDRAVVRLEPRAEPRHAG